MSSALARGISGATKKHFLSKKLSNQGFLAKAPEQLIEAEKAKLAKAEEKMSKIMESISALEARK